MGRVRTLADGMSHNKFSASDGGEDASGRSQSAGKDSNRPRIMQRPGLIVPDDSLVVATGIGEDLRRFNDVIRGKQRERFKDAIKDPGMMVPGKDGKVYRLPMPQIDMPRIRHGSNQGDGQGQGDGQPGQPGQPGKPGQAPGQAGDQETDVQLGDPIAIDELMAWFQEELELPRIEPKGNKELDQIEWRLRSRGKKGRIRHDYQTMRAAIARAIATGEFVPGQAPPVRPDSIVYRAFKEQRQPNANAAIIYMMDASGSMHKEQRDMAKAQAFWIDKWLAHHYRHLQTHFIIHNSMAHKVDREEFFSVQGTGGTKISSAFRKCVDVMHEHCPPDQWNVYVFHFSDGDNWTTADTGRCISMLEQEILPAVNLFGYSQVESAYGTGDFLKAVREGLIDHEKVISHHTESLDGTQRALKALLGTGK